MSAWLLFSLLACDQIQDMVPVDLGSSSSSSSSSGGDAGGEEPSGPATIGVRTTPAPKKLLINPGTSTALPPPPVALDATQCNDLTDGGEVKDGCITDTIECGQTVVGHTRGGIDAFNTRFWEKHFCWPGTVPHDGGDERVYRFTATEKGRVYFTLDTPCANLDMMAIRWEGRGCPEMNSEIEDCEAKVKKGTTREAVDVPAKPGWEYLVVVEGSGDEEGPFAVTAQCGPWR